MAYISKRKGLKIKQLPELTRQTKNGSPLHQYESREIWLLQLWYQGIGIGQWKYGWKRSGGISNSLFRRPGFTGKWVGWCPSGLTPYVAGMDYLETDKRCSENPGATLGSSLVGKFALWAAVTDTRFGMTLLGNSGSRMWCTSGAVNYGETLQNMVRCTCQTLDFAECK